MCSKTIIYICESMTVNSISYYINKLIIQGANDQSINQSINHIQSINQLTNKTIDRSIESINQSID